MKLGITAKLFLAILAACVAVLLINGIAVQAFVKRQFLDYLNEQGVERMQETLPRVRAEYARHGSWEFVRDNPDAWFVLMRPERGPGPPRRHRRFPTRPARCFASRCSTRTTRR